MGATRRITLEVSEAAATVLEGDPARVRNLVTLATLLEPTEVERLARERAVAAFADPARPGVSEEEAAELLAEWNAEGRS